MKKSILALFLIMTFLTSCNFSANSSSTKAETMSSKDTPLLEKSAIELLKAGTYSLSFTMDLTYPDFKYQLDCIMAQDGDKYVFLSGGDVPHNGYLKSRIITKGYDTYFVNDVNKTYVFNIGSKDDDDNEDETDETTHDFKNMKLLGEGKEAINGIQCRYEEYMLDDSKTRFYFNAKNQLYAIKGLAVTVNSTLDGSMQGDVLILVKDVSPIAPAGIFDIPADYTIISHS